MEAGRTAGANQPVSPVCPTCGNRLLASGGGWCLPLGRALSLIGGLALLTAYYMPWFATQGIILTGSFLSQLLGSTNDLRRFVPGSSGGPGEIQLLRTLVYLFPACGILAAALAALGALRPRLRALNPLLALSGLVPLVALILGVSRLPAGATSEIGLWQIGVGSVAILLGVGLEIVLNRGRDNIRA